MDKYKNEYLSLSNDDEDFAAIWKDTEEDFKEWCNVHDIKLEEEVYIETLNGPEIRDNGENYK
jgi:hypothetical protein